MNSLKPGFFKLSAPVVAAAFGAFFALAVSKTDAADRAPAQAQAASCPTPAAALTLPDPAAAQRERDADPIYMLHNIG